MKMLTRFALAAGLCLAATTANAATLDLTTFHVSHYEGSTYTPGAGVGFSTAITPSTLVISSDGNPIPAEDPPYAAGPHVQNVPQAFGDFSLVVRAQSTLSQGNGGIFVDGISKDGTPGGAGIGFGSNGFNGNYFFGMGNNVGPVSYGGGPIDFRIALSGGTLSFDYSLDAGATFLSLYSLSGISGFAPAPDLPANPFFDFTAGGPVGATPTGSASFTILSFESSVPEPSQWAMMLLGFGMIGATARRKYVRPVIA